MKNFKDLSFKNIAVEYNSNNIFGNKINIRVISEDNDCLAEANCQVESLKDFSSNCFYPELLQKEIDYFFLEVFSDEERIKTKDISLSELVEYINNKYGEDDTSTLNELYKSYININDYLSDNKTSNAVFNSDEYVRINNISSSYENTGAGTLIVDFLKENFKLIFLYGTMEAEGYWLDKVNFKEILNGFMYWSNDKKLNEIL